MMAAPDTATAATTAAATKPASNTAAGGFATSTLSLSDGRVLSVHEFGASSGRPVLFMHGGGVGATGRFAAPAAEAAERHGVRLVAPDRPALGRSSPQPRRSVANWIGDMAELADSLDLATFDIVSHSGGAGYALACASVMPGRVRSVSLVSPMASWPLVRSGGWLPIKAKLSMRVNASMPDRILASLFGRIETGLERDPQAACRSFLRRLPTCEQESVAASDIERYLPDCVGAALHQGAAGAIADLRLVFKDWGFPLESVHTPVTIWHGGCDTTSPPAVARLLAGRLAHCTLHTLPNEGHLSVWLTRGDDILAGICEPPAGDRRGRPKVG